MRLMRKRVKVDKRYFNIYKNILELAKINYKDYFLFTTYDYPINIIDVADTLNINFNVNFSTKDEYDDMKRVLTDTQENYENILIDVNNKIDIELESINFPIHYKILNENLDSSMLSKEDIVSLNAEKRLIDWKIANMIVMYFILMTNLKESFFIKSKKYYFIKNELMKNTIIYNACALFYPNYTYHNKYEEYNCLKFCWEFKRSFKKAFK